MSSDPKVGDIELLVLEGTATARDQVVRELQPLVSRLARRFQGRGVEVEDLEQVAALGLLKAMDRYETGHGARFTTYATATIVGELKRHLRDKGWTVRVPRRLQELGREVGNTITRMSQELGRSPTVAEVAQITQLTEEEVLEGMQLGSAYSPDSLDRPVGAEDGSATAGDLLGFDDEMIAMTDRWSEVKDAIATLPERERKIIYLRFFEGKTQSEIADEVGMSQMHVSRLLRKAIGSIQELVVAG